MRVTDKILVPATSAFQNGPMFQFFKDRRPGYIDETLANPQRTAAKAGFAWLDKQLSDGRKFLCGDRFSLGDIRLYCLFSFYITIDKSQHLDSNLTHVAAYFERIKARPSATAIIPK